MRKILTALFIICAASCLARDGVPADQGTNLAHIIQSEHTLAYDKYNTFTATTVQKYAWPDYVQDGLIHMWDGILNTGKDTHKDGDIPYWKDVIGDLDLMITSTSIYFNTNSLCMPRLGSSSLAATNRSYGVARSTSYVKDEGSYVTVEVCVSNIDNGYYYFPGSKETMPTVFNSSANKFYSSSASSWYSPFFIATSGYGAGWYGDDAYRLITARSYNGSVRTINWNLYGSYKYVRGQFTVSYENPDRDYTTSSMYGQPYHTSIITLYSFGNSLATYNMTTNAYTNYDTSGTVKSSQTIEAQDYLTIGGIVGVVSGQTYPWGKTPECLHWNGHVYNVRIYNRKLTEEEKLKNYEVDFRRFYNKDENYYNPKL